MPKTKISEFSATPANNTDIDSINIAEGCAPSGINDAIRELMAQLKDFQTGAVGDSFNGPIGTSTAAAGAFTTLSASGTTTLSGLTASTALALDASKNVVSVTNTGTGNNVLATSPTLVTPALGTPSALVGTNITGTATSFNINGTVGATTPTTGAFTTLSASGNVTLSGGTANGVAYLNGSKVVTSGSALQFDGNNFGVGGTPNGYGSTYTVATINNATDGSVLDLNLAGTRRATFFTTTVEARIGSITNIPFSFYQNNSEQMRLTSTGLGIGTSSPAQKLTVLGDNNQIGINTTGSFSSLYFYSSGTQKGGLYYTVSGENFTLINNGTTGNLIFANNGAERMRIDSSGNVGIGTSSPVSKLQVVDGDITVTTSGSFSYLNSTRAFTPSGAGQLIGGLRFRGYSTGTTYVDGAQILAYSDGAAWSSTSAPTYLSFQTTASGATSTTERMRLDSSGNLGLGVTPSAWGSVWKAQQFQVGGFIASQTNANDIIHVGTNAFANSSNAWTYINTAASTRYQQYQGAHSWYNAASGTAGNAITFTQAMTLTSGGKLFVNTTTGFIGVSNVKVDVAGRYNSGISGVGSYSFGASDSGGAFVINDTSNGSTEVERARIDSSGDLLVGTTSQLYGAAGSRLNVDAGSNGGATIKTSGGSAQASIYCFNSATTGDNAFISFGTEATWTSRGSITYNRAGGLVVYNTTSDYRVKDIIGSVTDSGSVIDSTPVYMGKMHGATHERPMFIAHETPAYAHTGDKDAVDADGNPIYQQMDASALIPVMWAEIQSLRKRLADAGI